LWWEGISCNSQSKIVSKYLELKWKSAEIPWNSSDAKVPDFDLLANPATEDQWDQLRNLGIFELRLGLKYATLLPFKNNFCLCKIGYFHTIHIPPLFYTVVDNKQNHEKLKCAWLGFWACFKEWPNPILIQLWNWT